jgi:hypothetical protein
MKSLVLGLVLLASSAFATTVTFDTNNSGTTFDCSGYSGTGSCSFNALTPYVVRVDDIILTYTPNAASVTAPPQTSIGAGDITVTCAAQATCASFADFSGVQFTLNIHETSAVNDDALFTAILTGSSSLTSSSIRVPLVPTSVTLASGLTSVTFTPDQPILGYTLNPPSDGRATTLQFLVDSSTRDVVPEPSSLALLASGLIGLGFVARRKR